MKTHVCKLALIAISALFLNLESGRCADTVPPEKATPGSAAETDTKTQENNPSGPAKQTTASTPSDTKNDTNNANGTETQKTASGVGPKSSKKHHHKHKAATATADSDAKPDKQ